MDNPTDAAVEALAHELRPVYSSGGNYLWNRLKAVARHVLTRQPGSEDVERIENALIDAYREWCGSGDASSAYRAYARAILALYAPLPEDARACIGRLTLRVNELRAELEALENTPAYAPTRSALDSALDPMLGNTPVRKAVVDAVLGLFEDARRPLTEAQIWEITKGAYEDRRFRQKFGPAWEGKAFGEQLTLFDATRYILAAASWPMTTATDSAASDRLAWLEKTHSETMDQNARIIVERDALNGRVIELEDRLATVLSQRSTYKADRDIANARVATLESELAAAQMSATDLKNLDEVVAILGIEDSTTTPAEAVFELHKEIERLRSELAAAKSPPPGTIRLGEGLTEAQEKFTAVSKLRNASLMEKICDALGHIVWIDTVQGFDFWDQVNASAGSMATALRASATAMPAKFLPEDYSHVADLIQSNMVCEDQANLRAILSNNLNMIIAALRDGGV